LGALLLDSLQKSSGLADSVVNGRDALMRVQFDVPARLERIIKIIQICELIAFSIYIELYEFYGYTLHTVPNKAAGEIYPLNLHGHWVYLNYSQHRWLAIFGYLAAFFGASFASICAYAFHQHRKGREGFATIRLP
jgi:hypothetical protein